MGEMGSVHGDDMVMVIPPIPTHILLSGEKFQDTVETHRLRGLTYTQNKTRKIMSRRRGQTGRLKLRRHKHYCSGQCASLTHLLLGFNQIGSVGEGRLCTSWCGQDSGLLLWAPQEVPTGPTPVSSMIVDHTSVSQYS